jgi:hypothetical protein
MTTRRLLLAYLDGLAKDLVGGVSGLKLYRPRLGFVGLYAELLASPVFKLSPALGTTMTVDAEPSICLGGLPHRTAIVIAATLSS